MKRILVTGATGFVGSNLVMKLVEKKYDVVAQGRRVKPWTPQCVKDRLITIDFDKESFQLGEFDTIVNCISVINPIINTWDEFSHANCSTTYSLVKKLSCRKFIHLSTCSVYSGNSQLHNQPDPNNLYGLSKYASEKIVQIERKNEYESTILRFPIIIGKNKKRSDFINYIFNKAVQEEPIELFGKGLYFRNIVHVSEAIKAIIASITSDNLEGFNIINIGSSNSLRIIDICELLVKNINSKSKIILLDQKASTDFHSFVDISKSSLINYKGLTVEENIDLLLKETA